MPVGFFPRMLSWLLSLSADGLVSLSEKPIGHRWEEVLLAYTGFWGRTYRFCGGSVLLVRGTSGRLPGDLRSWVSDAVSAMGLLGGVCSGSWGCAGCIITLPSPARPILMCAPAPPGAAASLLRCLFC